jgi:excisionase family DNA binding protein
MPSIRDALLAQAAALRMQADALEALAELEAADPSPGELLNLKEAARRLGVSRAFVANLIKRREIAAIRLGSRLWRIRAAELKAYQKRRIVR